MLGVWRLVRKGAGKAELKRKVNNGAMAVVACAAAALLLFCLFRGAGVEAAYPVENAKRTFTSRVLARLGGIFHASETAVENVRLRREVATLAMVQGENIRLEEENARLRAALDYVKNSPGKWVAASVLSEGGGAAAVRRTIRIGKGSLAGVEKGAVVAVPEGLVGRIVSVTPHTAEVLLIVDPSLKVSCIIEGERGAKGILSGGTDDLLVMRHFSFGATLTPGARVFTSGLGGVFPSGILVGTLQTQSAPEDGALPRECEVRPSVDFANLEDVFVEVRGKR